MRIFKIPHVLYMIIFIYNILYSIKKNKALPTVLGSALKNVLLYFLFLSNCIFGGENYLLLAVFVVTTART